MENLYDITKECKILDSEFNRYSFLLESDNNIINNYYLTGETLFLEADDSSKKPNILISMIEAIKRFITKCKAKFFKLIGSDKYKQYEAELSKNKELANKEIKYNPKTKETEILEKDTKDIEKMIEKIKSGSATDEEISKLEEQVNKHKGLSIAGAGLATGLGVYTLGELIKDCKIKKEKINDPSFQFIYQQDLLDPSKTAFSDKQIKQFQKAFALIKDNVEEKNKLLLQAQKEMDAILDKELRALIEAHGNSSYNAQKLAEKQVTFSKDGKKEKQKDIEKFRERTGRSDFARDNYDMYHKDKSHEEKQEMAKKLRDEMDDNEKYLHSRSLKTKIKDKVADVPEAVMYPEDYKARKKVEKEEIKKQREEKKAKKKEEERRKANENRLRRK